MNSEKPALQGTLKSTAANKVLVAVKKNTLGKGSA